MRCRVLVSICLTALGATSCTTPSGGNAPASTPIRPVVTLDYATAFFIDPDRDPQAVGIDIRADARSLDLIPFRSGEFAMAMFRCTGVTPRGNLKDCEVADLEPGASGYEPFAERLSSRLWIGQDDLDAVQQGLKFVVVDVRISNSDVAPWRGPCWPPNCSVTPPPPPLPQSTTPLP